MVEVKDILELLKDLTKEQLDNLQFYVNVEVSERTAGLQHG